MAVEGKSHVYLQKDVNATITIDCKNSIPQKYSLPTDVLDLYTPKTDTLKCAPGEEYDDDQIEELSKIIKQAEGSKPWISLMVYYDQFYTCFNFLVRITIQKPQLKAIRNALNEASIQITGTVGLNKYHSCCYAYNTWATHKFNIPIPGLGPNEQTLVGINGFSDVEQFCIQKDFADQATRMKLEYSVTLHWFDMNRAQVPAKKFNIIEKLFNDKTLADCCIIASNDVEINCHQSVLAVHSNVLRKMLTIGFQETRTKRIEMKETSEEGVRALVAFLYQWDTKAPVESDITAFELLQLAYKYLIRSLENTMLNIFSAKPEDWFSLNVVLELYFFVRNVKKFASLKQKMLVILKRTSEKLRESVEFKQLLVKNPNEAAELAFKLIHVKIH